ncbi:hypothetical protein EC973_007605 [Apophysomyces ossiformis]|uniref:WD40 repeat-like protein n=1 Tax=Apophysomyces ossiformis TaxID=679940 RepID=A0A8H7EQA3_9FUNG|nr:hypothetical protein EC973_007605 [Apophysomyces ossiformis]
MVPTQAVKRKHTIGPSETSCTNNTDQPIHPSLLRPSVLGTDPASWNVHQALRQRALHGQRVFGRQIHISTHSLLSYFTCPTNRVFPFYFPNGKRCVPYACAYAHEAHDGKMLAVADEERRVALIRTDRDNSETSVGYHTAFYTHKNTVIDVNWSQDDSMLLTGSADRLMRIWDVETQNCLATFEGHTMSLRSVNWHPTNPDLLVSASKDGSFRIWDIRYRQIRREEDDCIPVYAPIKVVNDAQDRTKAKKRKPNNNSSGPAAPDVSVTCALFLKHEDEKVVSCNSNGTVKLWDCRAGRDATPISSTVYEGPSGRPRGITDLKLDSSGTRLFSLCMDHSVYMHYLVDLSKPARRYTDPEYTNNSFFVKLALSPDDRFILAGSNSRSIFAWEVDRPQSQAIQLKGHQCEVTSVAWSHTTMNEFASCSDDCTVRIWNVDFNKTSDDS